MSFCGLVFCQGTLLESYRLPFLDPLATWLWRLLISYSRARPYPADGFRLEGERLEATPTYLFRLPPPFFFIPQR